MAVHAYPMMVDVSGRAIVIVGGGSVAVRKAKGLLAAGAKRVRVVALRFEAGMPQGVERVVESYRAEHLVGASLVFAATDSAEVNEAVVRDAQARGALVCRADANEEEPGDFSTPAILQRGPITVTVAAGGSPALAAEIRDAIGEKLDGRWEKMAAAMQTIRPMLLKSGLEAAARTRLFRDLATPAALAVLEGGGVEGLLAWLRSRHEGFEVKHGA